jgi:hypothetical protein
MSSCFNYMNCKILIIMTINFCQIESQIELKEIYKYLETVEMLNLRKT